MVSGASRAGTFGDRIVITAFIVVAVCCAVAAFFTGRALKVRLGRYYSRPSAASAWHRCFPGAREDEIGEFLHLFVDAFGLEAGKAFSFLPDDKLLAIYRTIYPERWMADGLEMEMLAKQCARCYGIDIGKSIGEDSTLGDVFRAIRERA